MSSDTERCDKNRAATYPRTPVDVDGVVIWLTRASKYKLPPELLKVILPLAQYDIVHFRASADHTYTESSNGPETRPSPYIETEPLKWLVKSDADGPGRIRRMTMHVTGRDQGWVTAHDGNSWSWFELGKRKSRTDDVQRGLVWVRNPVARIQYTEHRLVYDAENPDAAGEAMREWVESLENGDCIAIIPMARFRDWECNVKKADIDVEIELWR